MCAPGTCFKCCDHFDSLYRSAGTWLLPYVHWPGSSQLHELLRAIGFRRRLVNPRSRAKAKIGSSRAPRGPGADRVLAPTRT